MSMYGDSDYANEKNNLYDLIEDFLQNHPISDLLEIVTDVIRSNED